MFNFPVEILKVFCEMRLSMVIFDEHGHKSGGRGFGFKAIEVSLSHHELVVSRDQEEEVRHIGE